MKISVLTPSLNSARFIERAIFSVLKQNYTNWEHIIMDGGSMDGTVEVLKQYDHLIWASSPDKGQSDAMNRAFARSTGDIILYLNADDELAEGAFSRFAEEFSRKPKTDMIVGNVLVSMEDKTYVNVPSIELSVILHYWPCKFPLNPVSYAYRRSLQEKIGNFPTDNHYTMDYWFLLRAFLWGRIVKVNNTFGTFHFDKNNKSADVVRAMKYLKGVRNAFVRKYFYYPVVGKFVLRKLLRRYV